MRCIDLTAERPTAERASLALPASPVPFWQLQEGNNIAAGALASAIPPHPSTRLSHKHPWGAEPWVEMGSPQHSGGVNTVTDDDDAGGDFSKPFKLVAKILQRWFFTKSEEGTGRWEALGMVGVCLSRAVEFKLQTQAVRWMNGTLTTRNLDDFKKGLVQVAVLNFGGALLRILYSYLQARLTWKWRSKLTTHVHDAYFQNKAYYFIGEGGGVKGQKMLDADHRIVSTRAAPSIFSLKSIIDLISEQSLLD